LNNAGKEKGNFLSFENSDFRKDFEFGEQEVSTILKKSSVYKRTQTSTQNFYPSDFSSQQEYQFKKFKLSLNESSFLNVQKGMILSKRNLI